MIPLVLKYTHLNLTSVLLPWVEIYLYTIFGYTVAANCTKRIVTSLCPAYLLCTPLTPSL